MNSFQFFPKIIINVASVDFQKGNIAFLVHIPEPVNMRSCSVIEGARVLRSRGALCHMSIGTDCHRFIIHIHNKATALRITARKGESEINYTGLHD